MIDIKPFRGLRFNPERVDLTQTLVPPYDVLKAGDLQRYYDRDPFNSIRLEPPYEPGGSSDHREVGVTLLQWRKQGILLLDEQPNYYVLRQRFKAPWGAALERIGFIGALRLQEYATGNVLPHERTLHGPKRDRLKLLRSCRANLSCVFMLYEDKDNSLKDVLTVPFESGPVQSGVDDDGTEHALAPLCAPDSVRQVQEFMADGTLVIADGHHRYETAIAYRDECRRENRIQMMKSSEAPYERNLVYCANAHADGNLLMAIHRVVPHGANLGTKEWSRCLPDWEMREIQIDNVGEIGNLLAKNLTPLSDRPAFIVDNGTGLLRVFSKPDSNELPIKLIHDEVLSRVFGLTLEDVKDGAIQFEKSEFTAARLVREMSSAVALYLNPVKPTEIFQTTQGGDVLPQKSTFFYPKIPSGLVFRLHENYVQEGKVLGS